MCLSCSIICVICVFGSAPTDRWDKMTFSVMASSPNSILLEMQSVDLGRHKCRWGGKVLNWNDQSVEISSSKRNGISEARKWSVDYHAGKGSFSASRERLNRIYLREESGWERGRCGQSWSRVLQHFRSRKHSEALRRFVDSSEHGELIKNQPCQYRFSSV